MGDWIQVAGRGFSRNAAEQVLAGYCFGRRDLEWKPVPGIEGKALAPYAPVATEGLSLPYFGYTTYDDVEPGKSPRLEPVDLFVTAGLNARLDVDAAAGLIKVADQVSNALETLDEHLVLWNFTVDDLEEMDSLDTSASEREHIIGRSPLQGLYQAWWLLMSTPNIGVAVTHKVLHHKRPKLAPLIDGQTAPVLRAHRYALGLNSSWAAILHDLTEEEQADKFRDLEEFQREMSAAFGTRPILRLRIHDILLWSDVRGMRDHARARGKEVLDGQR